MRVKWCLLAVVVLMPCAVGANSDSPAGAASVVGSWELAGVDGHGNVVSPYRMVLVLGFGNEWRSYVWEEPRDVRPKEFTGQYSLRGDVLELSASGGGKPWAFRVSSRASLLILAPLPEDEHSLPLHFERRPWIHFMVSRQG